MLLPDILHCLYGGSMIRRHALTSALFSLTVLTGLSAEDTDKNPVAPLKQAHAHNDYLHRRPLLDALDNGFCSVEADIFMVGGQLLVAHTFFELDPKRSLRDLYLKPLQQRVKQNGGRVYPDGPVFTLLIDIKNNGEDTYRALHKMLAEYPDVFSRFENGVFTEKAVTVVISGDRPFELIRNTLPRIAGIDGRLTDLDSAMPAHLLPLISDNWRKHFRWRGDGRMPPEERKKLDQIIGQAHESGRRVRFWASPDKPAVWRVLRDAGADLINTDDLPGLRQFLSQAKSQ